MQPSLAQRKQQAKKMPRTKSFGTFKNMCLWFPKRVTIVSEGDSWFAYPTKWLVKTKPSNLIDHISGWTKGKANFLTMASNGDEAVDIVSGKQKHELIKVLRWHEKNNDIKPVDILLLSGGGNDLVGKNDFERFLKPYCLGYTARDCINMERLDRKCQQIALTYEELADIRDQYTPKTVIMTHTYDYPYPSDVGGVFLGGPLKYTTKSWMKPFMDLKKIPADLQLDVIKIFMDTMAEKLLVVGSRRKKFIVVDTRGTLKGKKDWLNEIHPDSKGFGMIAEILYARMTKSFPALK